MNRVKTGAQIYQGSSFFVIKISRVLICMPVRYSTASVF